MSIEVKVPAVGESITSGILSVWHKQEGETIAAGDILFTLETDKVSTEVNAPEGGVVHLEVAEGEEVKIGQTVARIEAAAPAAAASESPAPKKSPKKAPPAAPPAEAAKPEPAAAPTAAAPAPAAPAAAPSVSIPEPATLSLTTLPAPEGRVTRRKLTPLRKKIATQLVSVQRNAAILTTFNECDMSSVIQLRKEMQEEFSKKHGVKLGFMSFFIKAAVDALKAVPSINARIDGDELLLNHFYDIGVAVGTDRGLMVPVVRDCDQLGFGGIEAALAAYAVKAREGKISLADLQGGVFTISNGGVYGSLLSTPILNPPQSGILGMHKIQQRPVAVEGRVEIRPMMYLALSYDHRVVDGKEAVTFLVRVKECIENPARLLLGV